MGNRIYDPCCALASGNLVCGVDPTKPDSVPVLVKPSAPLPSQAPNAAQVEAARKNGWLVRLPDGTVCGFLTEATAGVDGKRINYGCTDGTSILGDLAPGAVWTAEFVTGSVGPNGFEAKTRVVKPLSTVHQ